MSPHGTALITGASDGIGLELAKIMAADGWNLILVARREEILKSLADELSGKYNIQTKVIAGDLSKPEAPVEIFNEVRDSSIKVNALINNAGFGYYGRFKDQDIEKIINLIEVNVTSLVRLSHLFSAEMIVQGRGRIMNVSSVVGFFPVPFFTVYSASKAFVLSFSQSLSRELKGTGVTVTCLCPGSTESGFATAAGAKSVDKGFEKQMSALSVARLGYSEMMAGKSLVVTGLMNKFMTGMSSFLPRSLVINAAESVMRKRDF